MNIPRQLLYKILLEFNIKIICDRPSSPVQFILAQWTRRYKIWKTATPENVCEPSPTSSDLEAEQHHFEAGELSSRPFFDYYTITPLAKAIPCLFKNFCYIQFTFSINKGNLAPVNFGHRTSVLVCRTLGVASGDAQILPDRTAKEGTARELFWGI